MILLVTAWDYGFMLAVAAIAGALGGFAAELLQTRSKQTGTVEPPRWLAQARYYDLGWIASVLLGAVAAVAALYFFPPALTISVQTAEGTTQTQASYELVKLVALSLIVGSAGSGFLSAMHARGLAMLSAQQAKATEAAAKQEAKRIVEESAADATAVLDQAISAYKNQFDELLNQAASSTPATLVKKLQELDLVTPSGTKFKVVLEPGGKTFELPLSPTVQPELVADRIDEILGKVRADALRFIDERKEKRIAMAQQAISAVASMEPL